MTTLAIITTNMLITILLLHSNERATLCKNGRRKFYENDNSGVSKEMDRTIVLTVYVIYPTNNVKTPI